MLNRRIVKHPNKFINEYMIFLDLVLNIFIKQPLKANLLDKLECRITEIIPYL